MSNPEVGLQSERSAQDIVGGLTKPELPKDWQERAKTETENGVIKALTRIEKAFTNLKLEGAANKGGRVGSVEGMLDVDLLAYALALKKIDPKKGYYKGHFFPTYSAKGKRKKEIDINESKFVNDQGDKVSNDVIAYKVGDAAIVYNEHPAHGVSIVHSEVLDQHDFEEISQ